MVGSGAPLAGTSSGDVADRLARLEQRTADLVRWTKFLALLVILVLAVVTILII